MKYNSFSRVRSGYKGIKFHLYIYYLFCGNLNLLMPPDVRLKGKTFPNLQGLVSNSILKLNLISGIMFQHSKAICSTKIKIFYAVGQIRRRRKFFVG
jgi:hypothetical protein